MNKAKRIAELKVVADEEFGKAVIRMDKECVNCGKSAKEVTLAPHHWFVQKARSLLFRWDLRNGIALCWYCHMRLVHAFATYIIMEKIFRVAMARRSITQDTIKQMTWEADNKQWKLTIEWLEETIATLRGTK